MKRLHDVAVRMRPRIPRTLDGAPVGEDGPETEAEATDTDAAETGFSNRSGRAPIPARAPFAPSSRDLARQAAALADEEDTPSEAGADAQDDAFALSDLSDDPTESADMTKSTPRDERPVSVPRRQIWDLDTNDIEAELASHTVITDRTYVPDAERVASDVPSQDLDDADPLFAEPMSKSARTEQEDMASRALKALEQAEKQLEARGIPASALYEGDAARTRVLGFHARDLETDAISAVARKGSDTRFPAGWLVVVDGPGRGNYFAVTNSVSSLGRGLDQTICLNFGDVSISRNNHAAIAYDAEQNRFFLGHGNKSNIVRRNGQPVLATEELTHGDEIRIGKTSLRFVALCGEDFTWGPDIAEGGDAD